MSQTTTGLYKLVGVPAFYRLLQSGLAKPGGYRTLAEDLIAAAPGDRVLDLGCGSAAILEFLPNVRYLGIDDNPRHIEAARARYGEQGKFIVGDASRLTDLGTDYDLVLILGVLHHLGDAEAGAALAAAARALKPGGRLFTIDPCWLPGQHWIARFLISRDSGRSVRDESGYVALAKQHFGRVSSVLRQDLLRVPYSHCIMDASQPRKLA